MMVSQCERGLIIDEPWISKILAGEKVWEMRSQKTQVRGLIALIRKGSGAIVGVANLVGVSERHSVSSLAATEEFHRVGEALYRRPDYKWWFAWQLRDVRPLELPVPYIHRNGAVIWVRLDDNVINSITEQEGLPMSSIDNEREVSRRDFTLEPTSNDQECCSQEPETQRVVSISIILTAGNVNNNHFYIPRDTKLFPTAVWGGKNKSELGELAEFRFQGLSYSLRSDIDGAKRILRNRKAVGEFYRLHNACEGDELRITKVGNDSFVVSLAK